RNPVVQILLDQVFHESILPTCRRRIFPSSPRKRGQYSRALLAMPEHFSPTGVYWAPALAGAASNRLRRYDPTPQNSIIGQRPAKATLGGDCSDRARRDIHRQRQQRGVEYE